MKTHVIASKAKQSHVIARSKATKQSQYCHPEPFASLEGKLREGSKHLDSSAWFDFAHHRSPQNDTHCHPEASKKPKDLTLRFFGRLRSLRMTMLIAFCLLLAVPAYAGLAVSVEGGDWAVGNIGMGIAKATTGSNWTVTNEGDETESVYIKVDGTDTHPGSSAGADTFVLKHNASGAWSSAVTNTSNGIFLTSLLADGTKGFDLQLTGPTEYSTASGQQALTVTLTAAAHQAGDDLIIAHTIGDISPETVTITYKTVVTDLSGSTKTWLAQNLGATQQATSATDAADASAGWYWQFNRKQGYVYTSSRIPATTWITSIDEDSQWLPANDPCTLLLGTGWRIPTSAEWTSADSTGSWNNYNDTFNSVLKLHAAGYLNYSSGALNYRGTYGYYWSSTQLSSTTGSSLNFGSSYSGMSYSTKAYGFSLRCIKD
jgi:uncharacterized protein (TIGR02145 family)